MSSGHQHGDEPRWVNRLMLILVLFMIVAMVLGLVLLRRREEPRRSELRQPNGATASAHTTSFVKGEASRLLT